MIPELGHFALILALLLACAQAVLPLVGAASTRLAGWMAFGRPLAAGQCVFVALSFVCLVHAFVTDDFSVAYAASNSNSLLPWYYKVSAVWGGHEGSLLLWILMLAGWGLAVAVFSRSLPTPLVARVLAVMGMIGVGFLLFILLTSNPFERLLPTPPSDGADLNPLLQDIGLILHPPMLYMGYVGFSVAFAFAIAALLGGKLDAAWARWSRPWTTVAWAFLTLGIALGSWWAYYELGWGGWWFWDPVENASLMPWLAGTALMHSLAVTEKRGAFRSWTVLLAIFSFSLSLLGTFLVRSGVLTSVHAFASDPARGQFILALLGITVVGSLTLYALRAPVVHTAGRHGLASRETFLLLNNVLLIAALLAVMIGTLYPLVLDFVGGGKLSVGPPYFNALFAPLTVVLALALGVGIYSRWKQTPAKVLLGRLGWPLLGSLVIAFAVPGVMGEGFPLWVVAGCFAAAWISLATVRDLFDKVRPPGARGWRSVTRSYMGMILGHLGLAMTIAGATVVSAYSVERDVRMSPGDEVTLSGWTFRFEGLDHREGANFVSDRAHFLITQDGRPVTRLHPEKRKYVVQRSIMTEAGIDPGFWRDLYVSMGEPLDGEAWAIRVQYKPLVRWLWLGALLMALGGGLAISDKRYRLARAAAAQRAPSVEGLQEVRS